MKRQKKQSIAQSLTISLIFMTIVLSLAFIFLNYYMLSEREKKRILNIADETIVTIARTLAVPLWDVDSKNIDNICSFYYQNESILLVRLKDVAGKILYMEEKKAENNGEYLVKRSQDIVYKDELLGNIELVITPKKSLEFTRQILTASAVGLLITVIGLFVFTGFLLKIYLKKPIGYLNEIVDSFSKGDYSQPPQAKNYVEFESLIALFIDMGNKIKIQMAELREAYDTINMSPAVAFLWKNAKGWPVEFASDNAKQLYGYTADDFTSGKISYGAVIHPDDLKRMEQGVDSAILEIENQKPIHETYRIITKNGDIKWVDVMSRVQEDSQGHVTYYQGVVVDVTARIHAQKELEKYRDHLEELVKERTSELTVAKTKAEAATVAKSEFLANMSHEIRTPMNAVLGFLQLVIEDPSLPENLRSQLKTSQTSAKSLLNLINDILDISKMEHGKLTVENRHFDLVKLLQNIYSEMKIQAQQKRLNLQLDIHPSLSDIFFGDTLKLRQILINLVGNAIKFTEKGSVTIGVIPAEKEGLIHFMIGDSGIGIQADRLNMIFEPFSQVDASMTRRFGGTGLGTTIARELVNLMGGRIWAESEVDIGSTFHFTVNLPFGDKDSEAVESFMAPARVVTPDLRRVFNVLLVEDIEVNVDLAKIRLKKEGHTVTVARNGREALDAFRPDRFDVILMDIQMPVMGGTEAVIQIRRQETETGGHVPIIAMTASVMKEEREMYLAEGMDDVIGKPVDFEELFTTMESVVSETVDQNIPEEKTEDDVLPESGLPALNGVDLKKGLDTWQDQDVYFEVLSGFSTNYGSSADDLLRLIKAGDIEGAQHKAHALKGVAGHLSLTEVAPAVTSIDSALKKEMMEGIQEKIETLASALETAGQSIERLCS